MAKLLNLLKINLKLFDGATAPAAGGDGGEAGESGGAQTLPLNTRKGEKSGEKVVYGKPPETAADDKSGSVAGDTAKQEKPALTPEEKRKAYNELISGEYKDVHTQSLNEIFNRRFKEVKTTEETVAKQNAVIEPLMQKYGVNDVDSLSKAIDEDKSFWEAAAEDAGMSIPQFKDYQRALRENAQSREREQLTQAQEQARGQAQKWISESDALKATPGYENFNLENEWQNPEFQRLLKSNVDVRHAYDVIHIDDIKQTVAQDTAKQTEKAVIDNVRARGTRPSENGVSSSTGVIYKSDPSKYTKQDRDEIARRVARGEIIKL